MARAIFGSELLDKFVGFGEIVDPKAGAKEVHRILRSAVYYLANQTGYQVTIDRGRYYFGDKEEQVLTRVGSFLRIILSNSDKARIPEFDAERTSLGQSLVKSITDGNGIRFICPVCPDYGGGDSFYKSIGNGISPEAMGAIDFTRILKLLGMAGYRASAKILVADTEDDIPEIIGRVSGGKKHGYFESCQKSVEAIAKVVDDNLSVQVMRFTEYLGSEFRYKQYQYQELASKMIHTDKSFSRLISKIGDQRKVRHSQILGRQEKEYELTLRYLSQYAALSSIVRGYGDGVVLVNYPTPNRAFFNAVSNIDRNFCLSSDDSRVIPVIGTNVKR